MMFSRVNPAGWTDGDLLTREQANRLDIEHERAVDGVFGGRYTPTGPLVINGAGLAINDGRQWIQRQTFQMTSDARVLWRVKLDAFDINWTVIDTSYDEWHAKAPMTSEVQVYLNVFETDVPGVGTVKLPLPGNRVRVINTVNSGHHLRLWSSRGGSQVELVILAASIAWGPKWAECTFDGTGQWRVTAGWFI